MEDRKIVDQLKEGNDEVLAQVYQSYRNEFMTWLINRYQCEVDEAKDHYQFAILKFYENVVSGKLSDLSSSIKTYLFAIGKNKALESKKSANRFVDNPTISTDEEDSPNEAIEKEAKMVLVEKCLEKLGDPCESLLRQFYYHKRSMDEIADIFNYNNRDTAKNLKFKCLQRLRKLVNEEHLNPA